MMRKQSLARAAFAAALLVLALAVCAQAGNKQLMSEKMAKQDLTRNLVEAVVGYKVKSQGDFGLTDDPKYTVQTKVAAVIKGVVVDKMIYDKEKDIALAFGHLDLGDVVTVVGELKRFKDVSVEGFGFGTTSPAARGPLMALRAAVINAHDELAAKLVGEKIYSASTMENYILTKDVNRSKVCAAVFGAYIPNPGLNAPNRGWGWDEDGNAFVRLEIDARKVKDLLGANLVYKGENIIEVTGRGAQSDDLADDSGKLVKEGVDKTQYMNLDMPKKEEAPAQ